MSKNVFVSYAHQDNEADPGLQGWVSRLVTHVSRKISCQLGRPEYYQLWMDYKLRGNDEFSLEIEQQLAQADVLLVMMSNSWLESSWCQKELSVFCDTHADLAGRIFVVEQNEIQPSLKPEPLQKLLPYLFYQKNAKGYTRRFGDPVLRETDEEYYERVVDVAFDIADFLVKTDVKAPTNNTVSVGESPQHTVYVAPVHDTLYSQRDKLASELSQFGINVIPKKNIPEKNIKESLSDCSHFIQLLDENYSFGIPHEQYSVALSEEKSILQWRSSSLDLENINPDQKELLENETVIASSLTDFIRQVREKVTTKANNRQSMPNEGKLVFVHAAPEDFDCAYQLAKDLRNKGYGIALPRYKGEPTEIRESIKRAYLTCDFLLMLHKMSSASVVEHHLSEARIQTLKRSTQPPILVCQCASAEELYFIPPGTKTVTCNSSFEKTCIDELLQEVVA